MRSATIRLFISLLPSSTGRAVVLGAVAFGAAAFFFSAGSAFAQGWNPSDMLRRADRNGDGKLEEGEVDERFKGFLERAASEAGMRGGFPYDVRQLAEAMDRRRRERDDDDDDDRDRDRDRDRDQQSSKAEPLVPGFGETTDIPAPLGFGDGSVFLTRAQAEAQYGSRLVSMVDSMMERYDRDKSGALEQREWEGARWSSPPESSDANKDGILTQSELYLRLKDRYSGNDDDDDDDDDRNRDENRDGSSRLVATKAPPAGVLSNVPGVGTAPVAGADAPRPNRFLPTRDEDDDDEDRGDRRSYERSGPQPARPGVIIGGGPNGPAPGRIVAPNAPGSPQGPGSGRFSRDDRDEDEDEEADEEESQEDANRAKYMQFADRMIVSFDRNKDGILQKDEWSRMTGDPAAADYDKDGNLTKDEMFRRLSERYGGTSGGTTAMRSSAPRTSSLQTNRTGVSSKDAYAASRAYEQEGNKPAYRFLTPVERLPSGLPDWFLEKDKNADAQVGMYEYADEWSDEEAQKFLALDKNRDGFLSASEALGGDGQAAAGPSDAVPSGERRYGGPRDEDGSRDEDEDQDDEEEDER